MICATPAINGNGHETGSTGIVLDPEFAGMWIHPAPDEQKLMEFTLGLEGCRAPLIVWPRSKGRILVVGYDLFPLLQRWRIPFEVVEKEFASRDDAMMFIVREQLARPKLNPLATSYLRGVRYKAERQPHGGDRKSAARTVFQELKTAEALAEAFGVSAATIHRDGAVAQAIHEIMANCGAEARQLLLKAEARLKRQAVLDLAKLPVARQRSLLWELAIRGKLPRSWRNRGARTITLPRGLRAMAEMVPRRLGHERALEFERLLAEVLHPPAEMS